MHGTIMVLLGIVPVAFAAFGKFVVPLQIGAPEMAFAMVNMASYWAVFVGGIVMLISFFVPGGAAKSGWTSYVPLAAIADSGPGHLPVFNGQTLDRKSTRLNSSHITISYAVFCLKKKNKI